MRIKVCEPHEVVGCPQCPAPCEPCAMGYSCVTHDPSNDDILTIAQFAKTYGDGAVWAAACRVLRHAGGEAHHGDC